MKTIRKIFLFIGGIFAGAFLAIFLNIFKGDIAEVEEKIIKKAKKAEEKKREEITNTDPDVIADSIPGVRNAINKGRSSFRDKIKRNK